MKEKRKKTKTKKIKKIKFSDHLAELRSRFTKWFIFFIFASFLGYLFYKPLLAWVISPLGQPLVYTSPVGGLETVLGVSVLFGFIVSVPVFFYQTIKYIEPAFPKIQVGKALLYLFVSFSLAVIGILICYYLVLPVSLEFLSKFASDQLKPLITVSDYFSFVSLYLLAFALIFQLPLCVYVLNNIKTISVNSLIKYFPYVLVASFILAAILTPTPDIINQFIMASPIIALYFFSIVLVYFLNNIKKTN